MSKDQSHVSPASALTAAWSPGSWPHTFYIELANAQRVYIPPPRFSEFEDEKDGEDSAAPELTVSQED
jgi:hypothetical protein